MFHHDAGPDWADEAIIKATPTPFLTRRWYKLAAQERAMLEATAAGRATHTDDDYDRVADLACLAVRELASRGVTVCAYCRDEALHTSAGCPDALAARLGVLS